MIYSQPVILAILISSLEEKISYSPVNTAEQTILALAHTKAAGTTFFLSVSPVLKVGAPTAGYCVCLVS